MKIEISKDTVLKANRKQSIQEFSTYYLELEC